MSETATPALPKGFSEAMVVDSGVEGGVYWITYSAPLWGAINGYVHVPEGHPWVGLDYDAIDVDVHGGLTYANGGWIGFDTLHLGDFWPGMVADHPRPRRDYEREWAPSDVAEEARRLARAVAESVGAA